MTCVAQLGMIYLSHPRTTVRKILDILSLGNSISNRAACLFGCMNYFLIQHVDLLERTSDVGFEHAGIQVRQSESRLGTP